MAASHLVQDLFTKYHDNAVQITTGTADSILSVVHPTVVAAVGLMVLIIGSRMVTGTMNVNEGMYRMVRAAIVLFIMTAATYHQYIIDPATNSIPALITQAVTGNSSATGAAAYDQALDSIWKMADSLVAQLASWLYIPERIVVWAVCGVAALFVVATAMIWMLAAVAIAFIAPLGAFLIPFALFDRTFDFTMRFAGKLVSLFLVMAVSIMLATFIINANQAFMQSYASSVTASVPAPGFSANNGDLTVTSFLDGAPMVEMNPNAATGGSAMSANISASIGALWGVAATDVFGFFLLLIVTGIAMFMGGASGFSAAPAAAAVYMVSRSITNTVSSGASSTVRAARS